MKEKGKKDLLETNITSHGSIKKLRSSSEWKRLRSLCHIVRGKGRGGAGKEKSACELHFVVYFKVFFVVVFESYEPNMLLF
jgi:hypothetical protein